MRKKMENMTDAELQRLLAQVEEKIRELEPTLNGELKEEAGDKLIPTTVEPNNPQLDELVKCRSKIEEELRKRTAKTE